MQPAWKVLKIGGIYSTIRMAARERWLGGTEDDQADFGRDSETDGGADSAETAINVNMRHGNGSGIEERRTERASDGSVRVGALIRSGGKERALIETSDVVGDKARGAEAMVEDLDLDLSAVRVASERKLDAEFGGAIESVGIVRKEDVGHIAPDERLDASESLLTLAAGSALALIVNADEIE